MEDSLYFSEQHLAVRNMVREFARGEVAPVAAELDAKAEFPWANVKKMGELGLLGIPWPEELGGAGLDLLSYMIVINEMAKIDASHAITISAHTTLGTSPIVNFGTSAQKKRYVPLLASHDPGEDPQKGGMLRAAYGKGIYIYTGYAFFRQLPAGVPGAIRLYVNLLSAGHEKQ